MGMTKTAALREARRYVDLKLRGAVWVVSMPMDFSNHRGRATATVLRDFFAARLLKRNTRVALAARLMEIPVSAHALELLLDQPGSDVEILDQCVARFGAQAA